MEERRKTKRESLLRQRHGSQHHLFLTIQTLVTKEFDSTKLLVLRLVESRSEKGEPLGALIFAFSLSPLTGASCNTQQEKYLPSLFGHVFWEIEKSYPSIVETSFQKPPTRRSFVSSQVFTKNHETHDNNLIINKRTTAPFLLKHRASLFFVQRQHFVVVGKLRFTE